MKITFLLMWADGLGGTERAVLTQAEHLARHHEVEVLSVFRTSEKSFFAVDPRVRVRYLVDSTGPVPRPVRGGGLTDDACRALAAGRSRLIEPRWEPRAHRLADIEIEHALRGIDTDILVCTFPALMPAVTTLPPPGVVTVHQEHRPAQLRGGTGEALYQYLPRFDAVVVLTGRTRDWFAETFTDQCPRLAVIPNAVPPGHRPQSTLRNRIVTIAGRLVAEKQIDQAIRAFAQVAQVHPDWVLRVLGGGPLLGPLRRLVADLDLHDNVQVLGPSARMAEEWARASIALLSSRDGEALPLVLLEAFAAGVPAVSYDIQTGPAEIITHGENGFLVGPDDLGGLAEAVNKLIGDEAMRQAFGAAARRAAARYAVEEVMPQWERLYAQLLADRADPTWLPAKADRSAGWLARTGGSGFAPAAPRPDQMIVPDAAARAERRIEDATPGLIRSGGRLCTVADDLVPDDVLVSNLDLVTTALQRHGIEYWLVPDGGLRYRVAVWAERREAVLDALEATLADAPVYAETLGRGGTPSAVTLACCLRSADQAAGAAGLRVFRPVVTSSRTLRYGPAYGCDLEFWAASPTEVGSRVPMRRTVLGDVVAERLFVPATVTVGQRSYRTAEPFTRTLVSDVTFGVDVVYTWVDGADPDWVAGRNALLASLGRPVPPAAAGEARFRSRDELRYSLRSLDMFAPWVRHIYVVTAGQVPAWLDTGHPRVSVVDHRELFGAQAGLPTFNSHAIECRLHHIDGLAEHFVYFNDDFFLGRPLRPEQFFQPNGLAQFFLSPTPIEMSPVSDGDDFNFAAAKNNRRLIEDAFGHTLTHGLLHAPYALRRSVLTEIEQRFAAEVARTAASQVRSYTDVSVASSLHHYYGFFTGRAVPGVIKFSYVDTGQPSEHPQLTQILVTRGYDAFCLNDTHHGELDPAEQDLVVRGFLESYFPVPSQFELGSPRNGRARSA